MSPWATGLGTVSSVDRLIPAPRIRKHNPSLKSRVHSFVSLSFLKKNFSLHALYLLLGHCTCQFPLHVVPQLKSMPPGDPILVIFYCTCRINATANDSHQLKTWLIIKNRLAPFAVNQTTPGQMAWWGRTWMLGSRSSSWGAFPHASLSEPAQKASHSHCHSGMIKTTQNSHFSTSR